jgi:hypothetical protein
MIDMELWVKTYLDQLLEVARKLPDGPMRNAVLLRAEYTMDLVQAWLERKKQG